MSIKVDTASLRSLSTNAKTISNSVGSCAANVKSIRHSLPAEVLVKNGIGYSLNSAYSRIAAVQGRIIKLSTFLSETANSYSQTEQRLNSHIFGAISDVPSKTARDSKVASTVNDVIGKMGFLGNVVAFLMKPFAVWYDSGTFNIGDVGADNLASLIKFGNSRLKGLYEWRKSTKGLNKLARMLPERAHEVRIKRFFGLDDMFTGKASKASSWSNRFANNFNTMKNKKTPFKSYKSGGAKAAFEWAGIGLTAITNTISNIDEHKSGKISSGRAVAETVTETAIDVGKDWLIGAAVAAGLAATFGSAPVLVVGAATVGITVGLDLACKKITGSLCGEEKDFTETVSDIVLDVGELAISPQKRKVTSLIIKSNWLYLKKSFSRGFSPLFST